MAARQAEGEKQKAAQELALAELKDKSELAQQYLKVILDKDTKPADRALLLTALGGYRKAIPCRNGLRSNTSSTNQISIASCLRPRKKAMPNSRGDSAANEATITEKGIADLNAKIELGERRSGRARKAPGRASPEVERARALESKPDDCDRYR